MKLCAISSFPPKTCGVAEFHQDLLKELLPLLAPVELTSIALNEGDKLVKGYPADVRFQIRRNFQSDYLKAAAFINRLKPDLVLLQHEFDLFGGYCGRFAWDLIKNIDRPIVGIFHTVPVRADAHKPSSKRKFFLQAAAKLNRLIVIAPEAKRKLVSYGIAPEKITVIDHGAPDILAFKSASLRQKLHLPPTDFIVFNFGLLHPRKGLEYAVSAMKGIVRQKINCRLVIYATPLQNPVSQAYLSKLRLLIKKLRLGKYVILKKAFFNKERLYDYINACDIGVLPYIYKSYISSGVLSFFVAAAKPVITTRFAYASYLLSKNAAAFVPFKNSRAIGRAIYKLATDKSYYASIKKKLMILRQSILWENKAKEYLAVIRKVLEA